ncbi:MAG: hypothetical protein ACK2UE_04935 [Anaerolineales bacterium]
MFLFLGIIAVLGISQLIEKNKANRFQQQIREAYRNGNDAEILRLTNERDRKTAGIKKARGNTPEDLDYLEAMIVLDAAEHGVFTPDGHQVFERMNGHEAVNPAESEPEDYDLYN